MKAILLPLIFFTFILNGADTLPEKFDEIEEKIKKSKVAEVIKLKDPDKSEKKNGFVIIPMIYYTPETDFAFGASLMYYYRLKSQSLLNRPSYLETHFIYTLNNQIISELNVENYFFNDRLHFYGELEVSKYPDKYYGIGNFNPEGVEEDFTSLNTIFDMNGEVAVVENFFLGLNYNLNNFSMKEREEQLVSSNRFGEKFYLPGRLINGDVKGSDGGLYSGLGFFIRYDSRDKFTYPTDGNFSTLAFTGYHEYLGSDLDFFRIDLDIRHYLSIFEDVVLAMQFRMVFNFGDVPFTMMPEVGGTDNLRGYPEGRYRDRNALFLQTEVRLPLYWRFGWVVFFSIGDVYDQTGDLKADLIKYSGGIGLRFSVDKQEKINVRADFGMTPEGGNIYFYLLEAF